jgi:hypothetical protein
MNAATPAPKHRLASRGSASVAFENASRASPKRPLSIASVPARASADTSRARTSAAAAETAKSSSAGARRNRINRDAAVQGGNPPHGSQVTDPRELVVWQVYKSRPRRGFSRIVPAPFVPIGSPPSSASSPRTADRTRPVEAPLLPRPACQAQMPSIRRRRAIADHGR